MRAFIWPQTEKGNCCVSFNVIFLAKKGVLGLAGKPNHGNWLEVAFI